METDAGIAFMVRAVALGALGAALFLPIGSLGSRRWHVAAGCVVAALGTWAYAGHSQSMRWSLIGIPLDVAHHAAAGAWVGGLAIVGLVAMRRTEPDELVGLVRRFAELAKWSVIVIVGTGLLQSFRLVGSPTQLLSADHGQYLLVKVAVLAVMLWLADVNRRRVAERFQRPDTATPTAIFDLRRAMGIEMFVGIAIIGITAMLVVSPPAIANEDVTPATPTSVPAATVNPG
jgi:copper transport protein